MCAGGGNKAAREAKAAEDARQGRITRNVSSIESAYAGREPQYADFVKALRGQYGRDLGVQQANAGRKLKFSLAARGQTGGSVARDEGATFQREANDATLSAERAAEKAGADLRSSDEQSKQNLISLAQSGNSVGNVARQSAESMKASLDSARAAAAPQNLGDLFTNTLNTYQTAQQARAYRRGLGSLYPAPLGGR